jgi:formate dehydrogenase major subunit
MALRGHASIQGSTDIPTLFNLLPGYLAMPTAGLHDTLADYLGAVASKKQKGFWAEADTYVVSLLKAWWGDAARADNDWAYDYLPRLTGPHGTYQTVTDMLADKVEGYFLLGQNPAVGSANGRQQRLGMSHLKWLVVRDLTLIESATWWKDGPEIATGELRTEDIATEVFFMPAASHAEKAGTFTQTQRMLQWRHKALDPPDECQGDLDFFYKLGQRIREKLVGSTDPRDRPLLDLTWDYPAGEHDEANQGDASPEAVLAEINGHYRTGPEAGQPLSSYTQLRADGSTTAGCWIYTGVYAGGVNHAADRVPHGGPGRSQSQWGWAWPANRRILYNRASADPDGSRGANARNGSGGTRSWAAGSATTCPTSCSTALPAAARTRMWAARPPSRATTRSSCSPTARAGCLPPRAWSTGRSPRTTSRRNPRSRTRSTRSSRIPRASPSRGQTTSARRATAHLARTCTRTCSPRTGSPSSTPPAG